MTNNFNNGKYVQFGCGLSCPEGWTNFDSSPRLRIERLPIIGEFLRASGKTLFPTEVFWGDIVKGLPVEPGTVQAVYCSHVLEHLDRTSVVRALENTFHMLEPGGYFRLVVPDLTWRVRAFLEGHERNDDEAADWFMKTTYLGVEEPVSGLISRLRQIFGNAAHRWMYDYGCMKRLLIDTGFVDIRRCAFGDAEDVMFSLVEEEGRFLDSGHEELAIEAKRPVVP